MRIFISISVLFIMSIGTSAYPSGARDRSNTTRRWYSVPDWVKEGQKNGPWLLRTYPSQQDPAYYVPYCYLEEEDFDSLDPIVQVGIQKWHDAVSSVSSLKFIPGSNSAKNLCDDSLDPPNVFGISDTTNFEGHPTLSTCGYGRNSQFGSLGMQFARTGWGSPDRARIRAEITMAHELGHIIGLYHEHQRPDAATNIDFRCENLDDYLRVYNDIQFERGAYRFGDTIELACSVRSIAIRHNFKAADFIPMDIQDWLIGGSVYEKSEDPDLESIMIYDSYWNSIRGDFPPASVPFPQGAVLVGHKPGAKFPLSDADSIQIYTGAGKVDNEYADWKISAGDVRRVAQLYPRIINA